MRLTTLLVVAGAISVIPVYGDLMTSPASGGTPPDGDGPGPGQVLIYSNFGPGGSFNTSTGYTIGGPTSQAIANSFNTSASVTFADAQLAMFSVGGSTAKVYLESDSGGNPDAILDTLVQVGLISTGAVVTFNCASCPVLAAGTQYWIIAAKGNGDSAWNWNNTGDTGAFAVNILNSATGPWVSEKSTRSAFEVDGVAGVPEPGSLILLGTVLFGVGMTFRRKFSQPHLRGRPLTR